jgi:hypothetical protein
MICSDCGMNVGDGSEFHPHMFCVLYKAGYKDPWAEFVRNIEAIHANSDAWIRTPKPPDMRRVWAAENAHA